MAPARRDAMVNRSAASHRGDTKRRVTPNRPLEERHCLVARKRRIPFSYAAAILGLRPLKDPLTAMRAQRTQLAGPRKRATSPFLSIAPRLYSSASSTSRAPTVHLGSNARKRPAKRSRLDRTRLASTRLDSRRVYSRPYPRREPGRRARRPARRRV